MQRRIATSKIEQRVLEACEPTLAELGYDCVHVQFVGARPGGGRALLRVFIDGEHGVSVDDCARASRQLDVVLDVEDAVPSAYTLEVSSPGLDRPLSRLSDFERFVGRQAVVKTRDPIGGRRNWTGRLTGVQDDTVLLEVDGQPVEIPANAIKQANLKHVFETAEVR